MLYIISASTKPSLNQLFQNRTNPCDLIDMSMESSAGHKGFANCINFLWAAWLSIVSEEKITAVGRLRPAFLESVKREQLPISFLLDSTLQQSQPLFRYLNTMRCEYSVMGLNTKRYGTTTYLHQLNHLCSHSSMGGAVWVGERGTATVLMATIFFLYGWLFVQLQTMSDYMAKLTRLVTSQEIHGID